MSRSLHSLANNISEKEKYFLYSYIKTTCAAHRCDRKIEEPFPLVVQNSMGMAVLQILHDSPDLVGYLCCLVEVYTCSESSHNHLHCIQPVLQLYLVIQQLLVELLLVSIQLNLSLSDLVHDLFRP